MQLPRLLLADDHRVLLAGLQKILEKNYDVVGLVEDGHTLLTEAQRLQPDVIILDISMPRLNGLDAMRRLRALAPGSRVVILTMHGDAVYAAKSFQAGASAFVVKRADPSELLHAIQVVARGHQYVTPLVTEALLRPLVEQEISPETLINLNMLTARQREILQLSAEGHSPKEIAAALHISVKTVSYHKAQISSRTGLHTAADLTRLAISHGLVPS